MQLNPGKPINFEQASSEVLNTGMPDSWMNTLLSVFRIMLIAGWVLLPLYLVMLIFSKEARKRLLRDIAMILPVLALLYLLNSSRVAENMAEGLNLNIGGNNDLELADGGASIAPPEFSPPPEWVTTAVIIGIAIVVALIVGVIIYVVWKRSKEKTLEPVRRVEREAQNALDAIGAGGDLRETILRCYYQMIESLKEYRGIYRDRDMTPHEFELLLSGRGMPREPVHQLTQLFEQVRYGAQSPGRKEEQIAVSSLSAIVTACQKTRSM